MFGRKRVAARDPLGCDEVAVGDVPCVNGEYPAVGGPSVFVDAAGGGGVRTQPEPPTLVGDKMAAHPAPLALACAHRGAPPDVPPVEHIQKKPPPHTAPQNRADAERARHRTGTLMVLIHKRNNVTRGRHDTQADFSALTTLFMEFVGGIPPTRHRTP